jgi:hypothetical protein
MEMTRRVGELARPVHTVAKENGLAWWTAMDAVRYCGEPLVEDPLRVAPVRAMGSTRPSGCQLTAKTPRAS